jgi:hypothetical protein
MGTVMIAKDLHPRNPLPGEARLATSQPDTLVGGRSGAVALRLGEQALRAEP